MSPTSSQRAVLLLIAASGLAAPLSFAAATSAASDPNGVASTSDAGSYIDLAAALHAKGELIRARALLQTLQSSEMGLVLGDELDQRVWRELASIERDIQRSDRTEIILQKAEHALRMDNLIEAERQLRVVDNATNANDDIRARASAVRSLIESRRTVAAPRINATLNSAVAAFNQGDYAKSKSIIERIGNLGLDLEPKARRTLAIYRTRIADLEQSSGERFGSPMSAMGMLAPESGENTEWLLETADAMMAQPVEVEDDTPDVEIVEETSSNPQVDLVETARKFEAQTLLANANVAYEERRLNEALDAYSTLMSNYSSYISADQQATARQRLSEIEIALGVQGGPTEGGLDEPIEEIGIILQRLEATYANLMTQSRDALASGDTSAASGFVAQARLEVQRARDVMPEARYEQYINELDTMSSTIAEREEQLRVQRLENERLEREQRTRELEAQRLQERDQRVIASIERVRALQQELKYEEALEIVENILFLDPGNPSGLLLKEIIEDTIVYREFLGYQRDKQLSWARQSLDNQEAMIASEFLIDYPDDWPAISFQRGNALEYADSEANRAVLTTLQETRMGVDFDDNALEDVLAFISTTSDIDIDTDWESLADIGVDPDSPVTLRLTSVTLETLLDRVLAKASDPALPASWAVQDGILTIASDEVLRQNTSLEIYDIRDLIVEVPDFDNAPDFNLQSSLSSGGGGGGGSSPFSGGSQDPELTPRGDRITAITDLIQASVDPDGWADAGGDTSSITELNGNLIITSTPRFHREIIGLLNKLRSQRAVQINVETRFLSVDQNFFEQIGFDLDVYLNANNSEYRLGQVIDPSLLPSDYFDPDTGLLLPNVSGGGLFPVDTDGDGIVDAITTINQPVIGPGGNGGVLPDGTVVGDDQWSVIRAAQNSFGLTETLAGASGFAADILSANPALGITARFLDDIQVDFLVEATQADQRSVTLTAPRLTFTNGQRAFITVSTQTTFVSDLQPVTGASSGAFDPVVTPITDGVLLDISGTVSADRRYVTLTVQTALTSNNLEGAVRTLSLQGAAGGGGTVGGDAGIFEGVIQQPVVTATQLNTTVTVPDQGTIMLGGQRLVEEVEVETGVPVLSKIPVLSRFFSNRIDVKEEKTLLVLIKPTILIQNEEEERHFPGLLDQL